MPREGRTTCWEHLTRTSRRMLRTQGHRSCPEEANKDGVNSQASVDPSDLLVEISVKMPPSVLSFCKVVIMDTFGQTCTKYKTYCKQAEYEHQNTANSGRYIFLKANIWTFANLVMLLDFHSPHTFSQPLRINSSNVKPSLPPQCCSALTLCSPQGKASLFLLTFSLLHRVTIGGF